MVPIPGGLCSATSNPWRLRPPGDRARGPTLPLRGRFRTTRASAGAIHGQAAEHPVEQQDVAVAQSTSSRPGWPSDVPTASAEATFDVACQAPEEFRPAPTDLEPSLAVRPVRIRENVVSHGRVPLNRTSVAGSEAFRVLFQGPARCSQRSREGRGFGALRAADARARRRRIRHCGDDRSPRALSARSRRGPGLGVSRNATECAFGNSAGPGQPPADHGGERDLYARRTANPSLAGRP